MENFILNVKIFFFLPISLIDFLKFYIKFDILFKENEIGKIGYIELRIFFSLLVFFFLNNEG